MESFLGASFIINLNSLMEHMNYVSYPHTRPLQKKQMASLLSWLGLFLLVKKAPWKEISKSAKRDGSKGAGVWKRWGGAKISHPAFLSHLAGPPQWSWKNWPTFPSFKSPHGSEAWYLFKFLHSLNLNWALPEGPAVLVERLQPGFHL